MQHRRIADVSRPVQRREAAAGRSRRDWQREHNPVFLADQAAGDEESLRRQISQLQPIPRLPIRRVEIIPNRDSDEVVMSTSMRELFGEDTSEDEEPTAKRYKGAQGSGGRQLSLPYLNQEGNPGQHKGTQGTRGQQLSLPYLDQEGNPDQPPLLSNRKRKAERNAAWRQELKRRKALRQQQRAAEQQQAEEEVFPPLPPHPLPKDLGAKFRPIKPPPPPQRKDELASPDTTEASRFEPVLCTDEAAELLRREMEECVGSGPTITMVCNRCSQMERATPQRGRMHRSLISDAQIIHKGAMEAAKLCDVIMRAVETLQHRSKRDLVQIREVTKTLDKLLCLEEVSKTPKTAQIGRVEPMVKGTPVVTL